MNYKNIFIAIGVFVASVILYKFLFGFVLPIVMFVSLGYVLKFLLKDEETDSVGEVSQLLDDSTNSSSTDNVVEIRPIKDNISEKRQDSIVEDLTDLVESSSKRGKTDDVSNSVSEEDKDIDLSKEEKTDMINNTFKNKNSDYKDKIE